MVQSSIHRLFPYTLTSRPLTSATLHFMELTAYRASTRGLKQKKTFENKHIKRGRKGEYHPMTGSLGPPTHPRLLSQGLRVPPGSAPPGGTLHRRIVPPGRQPTKIGEPRLQIWPQSPRAPKSSDLHKEMYYRCESGRQAARLEIPGSRSGPRAPELPKAPICIRRCTTGTSLGGRPPNWRFQAPDLAPEPQSSQKLRFE